MNFKLASKETLDNINYLNKEGVENSFIINN